MNVKQIWKVLLLAAVMAVAASGVSFAAEIRILWYSDGNEGQVLEELARRFEKDNPDIKVVIDTVSYNAVRETLPVQLEAGKGPDIARVTDLKLLSSHWLDMRPHLKDSAYWDANFASTLDWMRQDGTDAICGLMVQMTVTGPLVNLTLFEQSDIPIPGEGATWDEWVVALREVAKKQDVPMPLAMDRSGHRFAGPAISMGAKFIGADGLPAVIDDGFKKMAGYIDKWHKDGTMSKEIWASVSGTTYKGANEEFVNGQVVMYFSGSWQVAQFADKIGDNFDWAAVPQPKGAVSSTGMPGGGGVVAVKYTKNPKEVARFMDYLASEPVLKEFCERTLFLPAHKGLTEKGLDFKTNNEHAKKSLEVFLKAIGRLDPLAFKMQAYRWSGTVYAALISRLGQVVAGELTLEDAYKRIDDDIKKNVEEAMRKK